MLKWLLSWGKKKRQSLMLVGIVALLMGLILLVIGGYWLKWDWTGFGAQVNPGTKQYQSAKSLWDWLQLAGVVAIPIVVAWFTTRQKQDFQTAQAQREAEREIIADTQRETMLQAYLAKMSELLLDRNLRLSNPNDEVRQIARVQTLTILQRLDGTRKWNVLQFLHDANLVDKDHPIIDLRGANLSKVSLGAVTKFGGTWFTHIDLDKINLKQVDLSNADLSHASITEANLSGSILDGANFIGTDFSNTNLRNSSFFGTILQEATLYGSDLSGAYLKGAMVTQEQLEQAASLRHAIMPDGSAHP